LTVIAYCFLCIFVFLNFNSSDSLSSTFSSDGFEVARTYNRQLLSQAIQLIEHEWGVSCNEEVAPNEFREFSPMALVCLFMQK
jgi:hypothetical protein